MRISDRYPSPDVLAKALAAFYDALDEDAQPRMFDRDTDRVDAGGVNIVRALLVKGWRLPDGSGWDVERGAEHA